ncbi:hypothetical protein EYV94_21335 [Puteibacter caeruleilacunae]|nr:hypothetical protein EYV94_21335 [Puteibacter caeruleilacunae]
MIKRFISPFRLLLLLLQLSFVSCADYTSKKKVVLHHYSDNKIVKSDSIDLVLERKETGVKYLYTSGVDTLACSFLKSSDSTFIYQKKSCPLESTKIVCINNHSYCVEKYLYDETDIIDEECDLFYCKEYGLLILYDRGWCNLVITIEYDAIAEKIIETVFSDTTGFYLGNLSIPPPLNRE